MTSAAHAWVSQLQLRRPAVRLRPPALHRDRQLRQTGPDRRRRRRHSAREGLRVPAAALPASCPAQQGLPRWRERPGRAPAPSARSTSASPRGRLAPRHSWTAERSPPTAGLVIRLGQQRHRTTRPPTKPPNRATGDPTPRVPARPGSPRSAAALWAPARPPWAHDSRLIPGTASVSRWPRQPWPRSRSASVRDAATPTPTPRQRPTSASEMGSRPDES